FTDRNDRRRRPRDDHVDVGLDDSSYGGGIMIESPSWPADVNSQVLAFNVTPISQLFTKGLEHRRCGRYGRNHPNSDLPPRIALLRGSPYWPSGDAAEKPDEIAPSHIRPYT